MPERSLIQRLEAVLGVRPAGMRVMTGGCVGEVYLAALPDGQRVVVKVAGPQGTLDVEGFMLHRLAEAGLPVPRVLHASRELLVMEHAPGRSEFSSAAERHAAELLADLHRHTAGAFGLERDTVIGTLHQPNPATTSWIEFFREYRLLHMARMARDARRLPETTFARIESLAGRLGRFIDEPDRPSLVHGDVWTTNVLAENDRITAFLDPAIYFAHPEVELAFITLFGTFGSAFFEAYASRRPIRPGFFEVRRDVYNLYPLLVHVRLFGGDYGNQVSAILTRLGL